MKTVLLAGGFGSRISEESQFKPKPMIEIGGMPILWHIMKEYAYYGHNEFIICAGYKQEYIKEWFANYFLHNSDVSFDFRNGKNEMTVHHSNLEPWKVTIVDTGYNTMTGGRVKRIQEYVKGETFMLTYGDGVCDVDINKIIEFHKSHGKIATLTAVIQAQEKGVLNIDENNSVRSFREKNISDGAPINAGHREVELGIVPFNFRKEFIDTDFSVQFLSYLAPECLDGAFARLDLAAWGLPIVFPFAVAPLGGEYSITFADYGGDDFYGFPVGHGSRVMGVSMLPPWT